MRDAPFSKRNKETIVDLRYSFIYLSLSAHLKGRIGEYLLFFPKMLKTCGKGNQA